MTTTTNYGWTQPLVGGDNGTWGGELNTDLGQLDSYLGFLRVVAKSVTWNNGGTTTLDLSTGTVFFFTVATGGSTIAFSNVPANITAAQLSSPISLIITNGGSQAITWPGSVTWLGASVPALHTSGVDIIDLITKDNGTTWFGALRASSSSGVIFEANSLTTTNGAETSLATYVLQANTLNANGQGLRITLTGVAPAGGMSYNPKFGASSLTGGAQAVGGGLTWEATIKLVRTGATAQVSHVLCIDPNGVVNIARVAESETLSGAVTIDFRANATSGGQTATIDHVVVEHLHT